ncbi:MAG: cobalamin biosynthesis protein [Crenarchaeota archaeon]|nr:cobalamin biosynthesis protein [Thermoproteota archaeon]
MIKKISIILALILINTILIDFLNGEVRDKVCPIHPVKICWQLGSKILKNIKRTRSGGVILWISTVTPLLTIYAIVPMLLLYYLMNINIFYTILLIVTLSILNKFTISLKLLNWYYITILKYLENNNEAKARVLLQEIVRRDVFALDRDHVLSALIETYVESIVDGFVSPLFWFSIFGLVGSYLQRLANTMDSLVGYKHDPYRDVGWFSANVDTLLNIPGTVLFSIMLILVSFRRGMFKEFMSNVKRSRSVSSINARIVFSATSTVLKVDLEKPDEYRVGDYGTFPNIDHCKRLFKIVKRAVSLCILLLLIISLVVFSLVS